MSRITTIQLILAVLTACVLAGCKPTCTGYYNHGICIDLALTEPIQMGQPVPVNISIRTDKAQAQMPVVLDAQVRTDEYGQTNWNVDTQANVPVLLSTTVTLQEEGDHVLFASVVPNNIGQTVDDHVVVHLTAQGGTIIPTGGTPTAESNQHFLEQTSTP